MTKFEKDKRRDAENAEKTIFQAHFILCVPLRTSAYLGVLCASALIRALDFAFAFRRVCAKRRA